jgi:hypothetical protein
MDVETIESSKQADRPVLHGVEAIAASVWQQAKMACKASPYGYFYIECATKVAKWAAGYTLTLSPFLTQFRKA